MNRATGDDAAAAAAVVADKYCLNEDLEAGLTLEHGICSEELAMPKVVDQLQRNKVGEGVSTDAKVSLESKWMKVEESDTIITSDLPSRLYLTFLQITTLFIICLTVLHVPYIFIFYFSSFFDHRDGASMETKEDIQESDFFHRSSMSNWGGIGMRFRYDQIIVSVFECCILVTSLCYFLLSSYYVRKIHGDISRVKTVKDFSIHVHNLPAHEVVYGSKRLNKFFSAFGKVDHIALVLDSGDMEQLKKRMGHVLSDIKKINNEINSGNIGIMKKVWKRIEWVWLKIKEFYLEKEIKFLLDKKAYRCTGDAFIAFKYQHSKIEALKSLNKPLLRQILCCDPTPKYGSKGKYSLRASNAPHVADVIWENFAYKSTTLRPLISIAITGVSVCVTAFVCQLLESVRGTMASQSIQEIVINRELRAETIIGTGISVFVCLVTFLMTFVLYHMSNFEKHRFESKRKKSVMIKLVASQTILPLSSLLVLWYLSTSNSSAIFRQLIIMLSLMIASTVGKDALLGPFYFLKKKVSKFGCMSQNIEGNDEESKVMMDKKLPQYSLEYRYSYILKCIVLGVMFGGLIPFSMVILSIGLVIATITDKYNLSQVYRRFDYTPEDCLCLSALKTVFWSLILRYVLILVIHVVIPSFDRISWFPNLYIWTILVSIAVMIVKICIIHQFLLAENGFKFVREGEGERNLVIDRCFDGGLKYRPPLSPEEIKYPYLDSRIEQSRPHLGTAVELIRLW